MLVVLISLLIPASFPVMAQDIVPEEGETVIFYPGYVQGPASAETAKLFAFEHIDNLSTYPNGLELDYSSASSHTLHFNFRQTFLGIPIQGAGVTINLSPEGRVLSLFDYTIDTRTWDIAKIQAKKKVFDKEFALQKLSSMHRAGVEIAGEVSLLPNGEEDPVVGLAATLFNPLNSAHRFILLDDNYQIIENKDLHRYFQGDTTATVWVFNPDPLTTAHKTYGGLYSDNNDSDNLMLNNQRVNKTVTVNFIGSSFTLESPYAKITDLQPPSIPPATSADGTFNFTRSQDGFEDVNAFYHINAFHQYLEDLGYPTLASFQVQVDAHGSTDDNSYFVSNIPPRMILGEGGVDDGEDADVIIHEYGHGISFSANGNFNLDFERDALDEGLGDYLAASYSRAIDDYNWQNVFSWDGHNEYWSGRVVNSTQHYPDDLGSDIYTAGQIWSSVMMEIWTDLGREVTDKLMIESLYSWSSKMTMKDAALLVLQADQILNSGENYMTLFTRFYNRGLLSSIPTQINGNHSFLLDSGNLMAIIDQNSSTATLEIFDMQGKLIYARRDFKDKIVQIPRNWFHGSGMYIVRLQTSLEIISQKIIFVDH